jgi:hypothetical protein
MRFEETRSDSDSDAHVSTVSCLAEVSALSDWGGKRGPNLRRFGEPEFEAGVAVEGADAQALAQYTTLSTYATGPVNVICTRRLRVALSKYGSSRLPRRFFEPLMFDRLAMERELKT